VGADSLSGGALAACAALLIWVCSSIAVVMLITIAALQLREVVSVRIVIASLIYLFLVIALVPALCSLMTQYGTSGALYPCHCRSAVLRRMSLPQSTLIMMSPVGWANEQRFVEHPDICPRRDLV
jgi:hypothetical protein